MKFRHRIKDDKFSIGPAGFNTGIEVGTKWIRGVITNLRLTTIVEQGKGERHEYRKNEIPFIHYI